jgi:hypothetical protein
MLTFLVVVNIVFPYSILPCAQKYPSVRYLFLKVDGKTISINENCDFIRTEIFVSVNFYFYRRCFLNNTDAQLRKMISTKNVFKLKKKMAEMKPFSNLKVSFISKENIL